MEDWLFGYDIFKTIINEEIMEDWLLNYLFIALIIFFNIFI
jgi:hypothetical protein